jgi:hypothetical protein
MKRYFMPRVEVNETIPTATDATNAAADGTQNRAEYVYHRSRAHSSRVYLLMATSRNHGDVSVSQLFLLSFQLNDVCFGVNSVSQCYDTNDVVYTREDILPHCQLYTPPPRRRRTR